MDSQFRSPDPAQPAGNPRVVRPAQHETTYMNVPPPAGQGFSLTLGDIYYVLFRHKWKILICSLVGLGAAAALYKLRPPPYQSEAKLFIRYVIEGKSLGPGTDDSKKFVDQRGETIISSELEILTSLDLAEQVATAIGPDKILAKSQASQDPSLDLNRAAFLIRRDLTIDVPTKSSVLLLTFKHPDPQIVQPVLNAIIDRYLKKHVEIHRSAGVAGDFLTQETDTLRARLAQTEEELRKANNKAGVISLDDTKKVHTEEIAKIRDEIFSAQAELAERSSVYQEITKHSPAEAPAADSGPEPTPDQVSQYRNLIARQDNLQKREQELLTYFREDNQRVKDLRAQLAETADLKKKMEDENPKLARVVAVSTPRPAAATAANSPAAPYDPVAEAARLTALAAKIKVLNAQLDEIRGDAATVDQMEGTISELRRKKELEESNYKYYASSLEQSRIDEALGAGNESNISIIQTPSPPQRDWAKNIKILGMVAVGGMVTGLAWAFLVEMYFDRTIKRPIDVERMVKLPLFLSIPNLGRSERRRLQAAATERLSLPAPTNGSVPPVDSPPPPAAITTLATLDSVELLHPFHETLRDRLIAYFESKNLTHKPKLVAVTGLGRDSGVTTIAAGLAGSLSETGDGNVLLVDMTQGQGSAQQFYKGKAVCGLEEVLDTRNHAQIQDNLFVVGEGPGGDKLSRILPQRFNKLIPKLKASDFDYIIFDMPPVSQLSITPRLAGFMDMVLLVIESEKTDQVLVQRATTLLAESKAHVGAVLNKTKTYVPPRLHQESLGNL